MSYNFRSIYWQISFKAYTNQNSSETCTTFAKEKREGHLNINTHILNENNITTWLEYKASASIIEMRAASYVSLLRVRSMATCKPVIETHVLKINVMDANWQVVRRHGSTKETDRLTLTWLTISATGCELPFKLPYGFVRFPSYPSPSLSSTAAAVPWSLFHFIAKFVYSCTRSSVSAQLFIHFYTSEVCLLAVIFHPPDIKLRCGSPRDHVAAVKFLDAVSFRSNRVSVNWRLRQSIKHIDPTGLLGWNEENSFFSFIVSANLSFYLVKIKKWHS